MHDTDERIETVDDLAKALAAKKAGLDLRWVAKRSGPGTYYVTGQPFPDVPPAIVTAALRGGLLTEDVPGLWCRPQDKRVMRRRRR